MWTQIPGAEPCSIVHSFFPRNMPSSLTMRFLARPPAERVLLPPIVVRRSKTSSCHGRIIVMLLLCAGLCPYAAAQTSIPPAQHPPAQLNAGKLNAEQVV